MLAFMFMFVTETFRPTGPFLCSEECLGKIMNELECEAKFQSTFLDSWLLKIESDRLSRNVGRKLPRNYNYSLRNDPEERSSLLALK